MTADPSFQEQANIFAEQMQTVLADQKMQAHAHPAAEQMQRQMQMQKMLDRTLMSPNHVDLENTMFGKSTSLATQPRMNVKSLVAPPSMHTSSLRAPAALKLPGMAARTTPSRSAVRARAGVFARRKPPTVPEPELDEEEFVK